MTQQIALSFISGQRGNPTVYGKDWFIIVMILSACTLILLIIVILYKSSKPRRSSSLQGNTRVDSFEPEIT